MAYNVLMCRQETTQSLTHSLTHCKRYQLLEK